MVDLYRFMMKSHAESFMAGEIYMSSLGYFWNNGFESQQDIDEGTVEMQHVANSPLMHQQWSGCWPSGTT